MTTFESTLGPLVPTAALRGWLRPQLVDPRRHSTMSEPTQTATQDVRNDGTAPVPALLIVHHTDAHFVGSVAPIPPRGALTLGRDGGGLAPDALQDARISRSHAEVIATGKELKLRDLGSHNGTTVNGKPVTESALQVGDVIGLGPNLLLVTTPNPNRLRNPHPRLVGCSGELGQIIRHIERVAPLEPPVLV